MNVALDTISCAYAVVAPSPDPAVVFFVGIIAGAISYMAADFLVSRT